MLKRLHLHIGAPKTGTSAVQHILHSNRRICRANGITFFNNLCCGREDAHYTLFSQIKEKKNLLKKSLAEANCEIGVLSTEFLVFSINQPEYREHINQILDFCYDRGMTIDVVGVVREPLSYLVSAYGEDVIGGRCPLTFEGWLDSEQGRGHRRILQGFREWGRMVSRVRSHWFTYERERSAPGIVDVVVHQLSGQRISTNEAAMMRGNSRVRASFSGSVIEAVRRINAEVVKNWNTSLPNLSAFNFASNAIQTGLAATDSMLEPGNLMPEVDLKLAKRVFEEMKVGYESLVWEDGFRRPLDKGLDYYWSNALEKLAYDENVACKLSHEWKAILSTDRKARILNKSYCTALTVFRKFQNLTSRIPA